MFVMVQMDPIELHNQMPVILMMVFVDKPIMIIMAIFEMVHVLMGTNIPLLMCLVLIYDMMVDLLLHSPIEDIGHDQMDHL
jgi:H+/Cl- antiporter ClcA